ncbi:MAG: NUDIX domain-containing protein [Bacillaceae bacterium]
MGMSDYYKYMREKVGNTRIFMPCVAAIIRNENGHILFQYPGGKYWSLPAGAIELGETPAQAVIREVWEETGLIVKPTHLVGVFGGEEFRLTYENGHQVEYNVFVFQCEQVGGVLEAIDGESLQLGYFHPLKRPRLALPYPEYIFTAREATTYFQWKEEWLTNFLKKRE